MDFKKWTVADYDKQIAKMLADECDADPFLALIASSRGYTDPYEFEEFISDEYMLSSPFEFSGMQAAVDRIKEAVENGEKITVYGDYDCDGITSSALMFSYLSSCGAKVSCYIPDRLSEGYGMNCDAVRQIADDGTKLIITVDNGINSVDEVDLANSLGLDVIITDHHLPTGKLPNALAVIDPYADEDYSSLKQLAGVGVAFKLICAVEGVSPEEMLCNYSDLVCVGTISDIMPLIGENRSIVKAGLPLLESGSNLGLNALLKVSGYQDRRITSSAVSFAIAPRINAAGRMGDAKIAFELLTCNDPIKAESLAEQINQMNVLRQTTEQEITAQAIKIIEENGLNTDKIIVVCGSGWHHGVIGICAARLCERYTKPVIVFSSDGSTAVGSARSVKGFSIFDALSRVRDMTQKFGGHEQAAGLTVKANLVDEFRSKINSECFNMPLPIPELHLDCKLKISAINLALAGVLDSLAPFGVGNPTPVFGVYGVTLDRITPIGNGKHLRLLFKKDLSVLSAVMFSCTEQQLGFGVGDTVDLAVVLGVNLYNGEQQLSVQIKAIRAHECDGAKAYCEKILYEDFLAGKADDISSIAPSREEIGTVFRSIDKKISTHRAVNLLINTLGVGKILLSFDILCELGFIKRYESGGVSFIERIPLARKNDLNNSPTYTRTRGE